VSATGPAEQEGENMSDTTEALPDYREKVSEYNKG